MTTRCSTNWAIGARNTSILKPTSYWIQFQSSNHFPYTVIIRADNRTQVNQYSSLKTNSCITLSPRQISYARNTMWNLCSLEGWDALQSVWIFNKIWNGTNYIFLRWLAELPSLWTEVRLRVTLVWCKLSNRCKIPCKLLSCYFFLINATF